MYEFEKLSPSHLIQTTERKRKEREAPSVQIRNRLPNKKNGKEIAPMIAPNIPRVAYPLTVGLLVSVVVERKK